MTRDLADAARGLVAPLLADSGFDLEDLTVRQVGRRRLVEVVVDRDGGLTLDDVAEASRLLSDPLDAVVPGEYVLEVTSPGVDRPLTLPRHWRRNVGRLVRAICRDGRAPVGRVVTADDDTVTLDVDGAPVVLTLDAVARGEVQVEFSRPGAPAEEDAADETDETDDAEGED
jgi:ribosome maturation factor RimP